MHIYCIADNIWSARCFVLQSLLGSSEVICFEQKSYCITKSNNPCLATRCVSTFPAGYQHVTGKGGKVRRVLANRQSAQRSRIRKLQHISELEITLEALQDDLFKLNPQLSKLEAKQAGKAADTTCWKTL